MSAPEHTSPSRHGVMRRGFNAFIVVVNVVAAVVLLVCSYAGWLAPWQWRASTLVIMMFPAALALAVVMFVLDLIWWRRTALLMGLTMLVCATPITNFCPLNIPRGQVKAADADRKLTLLTYNVYCMYDITGEYPDNVNPQMKYILDTDADIVCVQEYFFLTPQAPMKLTHEQLDTLSARYPYIYMCGSTMAMMSKYPAEPIALDSVEKINKDYVQMAAWRIHVGDRVLNLFNLHLQSLAFTPDDKTLFSDVVKLDSLNRGSFAEVRRQIFPKIADASEIRARQAQQLLKYIGKYGGENVIVCGDFNDVPGCHTLRLLERDAHLRQVYPRVGFGPMNTYNKDYFLFRIDHVLYRGHLRPWSMRRGSLRASDHYPLLTTFLWDTPPTQ